MISIGRSNEETGDILAIGVVGITREFSCEKIATSKGVFVWR